MNIHDSFPSRYLKAPDLGMRAPVVVIRSVELQPMTLSTGKKVKKLVLFFVGKEKGLVLNKTNATAIAELVGSPETETWRGKSIRLFATTTTFGNATVPCVRVQAAGLAAVPRSGAA